MAEVAAHDVGDEARVGVVGHLDGDGLVAEAHQRRHRPEDLVRQDRRVGRHVRQHGRLVEVAAAVRCPAPGHHRGATGDRCLHETGHLRALASADQRTHLCVGAPVVADGEAGHPGAERLGELVGYPLVHVQAVRGDAGCAGVAHLGGDGRFGGHLHVRVGQHQERGVAAELHAGAQHPVGGEAQQVLADRDGAGEGQLADGPVRQHRHRGVVRRFGEHQIDDTGRRAATCHEVGDVVGGQRRRRCGLHDGRASGGESRGDLAHRHGSGEVPRRDLQGDPHRLGEHHDVLVAHRRAPDLPGDADRLLAEPAEEVGRVGHLAERLGHGLAVLELQQGGDLGLLGHHRLVAAPQDLRPLARRRGGPSAGRPGRRVDGRQAVVGRGGGDAGDEVARGGIEHVQPAVGVRGVTVEEQLPEPIQRIDHGRVLPDSGLVDPARPGGVIQPARPARRRPAPPGRTPRRPAAATRTGPGRTSGTRATRRSSGRYANSSPGTAVPADPAAWVP